MPASRLFLCLCSLSGFIAALTPSLAFAQSDDVTFLVMGKTTNHRQSSNGELSLLNYHFFAEIFVHEGGSVTNATLSFPNGEAKPFADLGFVQEVHGGRYKMESTLDNEYPNGDYVFRFDTPSGNVEGRVLSVRDTGGSTSRIPSPAQIHLSQNGRRAEPGSIDPAEDLLVSWSPFEKASADPNGILDDLLFVVLGNCHGDKTVHSGRPFEGTGHLSYDTTDYTIDSDKLSPGHAHQLVVEHARVDTSNDNGLVGLVTYAATSFLDFRTQGTAIGRRCPEVMPRIDEGQTDRPARK